MNDRIGSEFLSDCTIPSYLLTVLNRAAQDQQPMETINQSQVAFSQLIREQMKRPK